MRVHRRRGVLAVAALFAALAVSAIGASSASAVLRKFRMARSSLTSRCEGRRSGCRSSIIALQNMDYNGGAVMPSNTDYMIVWAPRGANAFPSEYMPGIAEYFKNLAHDSGGHQNVDSIATQYNDLSGASRQLPGDVRRA